MIRNEIEFYKEVGKLKKRSASFDEIINWLELQSKYLKLHKEIADISRLTAKQQKLIDETLGKYQKNSENKQLRHEVNKIFCIFAQLKGNRERITVFSSSNGNLSELKVHINKLHQLFLKLKQKNKTGPKSDYPLYWFVFQLSVVLTRHTGRQKGKPDWLLIIRMSIALMHKYKINPIDEIQDLRIETLNERFQKFPSKIRDLSNKEDIDLLLTKDYDFDPILIHTD